MNLPTLRLVLAALVAMASLVPASPVGAAAPNLLLVDGVLKATGGGVGVDGKYPMTFTLYTAASGGTTLWTEIQTGVQVSGGIYSTHIGKVDPTKPLPVAKFQSEPEVWLGVKIFDDPELPRVRLLSVPYALEAAHAASAASIDGGLSGDKLAPASVGPDKIAFTYAGSSTKGGAAMDVACTGCIGVSEMSFDADLDLNGHNLLGVTVLSAQQFIGDGSKLTGIKLPQGTCEIGSVVTGVTSDGKLVCSSSAASLPKDGIDEVSNGLIWNQFTDVFGSTSTPIPIKDYFPPGVYDEISVLDVGTAQKLTVSIEISGSSDVKGLKVLLYDPNNVEYLLFDKNGSGPNIKTTYPDPTKTLTGDLTAWIGKNPAGKWRIQAIDSIFKDATTDGAIVAWSVNIQTLSSKKIRVAGSLIVDGGISGTNGLNVTGALSVSGDINAGGSVTVAKDLTVTGNTSFAGGGTISGQVSFKDVVTFEAGLTFPNQQTFTLCTSNDKAGSCYPTMYSERTFVEAAKYCAAKKQDLCSDAQTTVMRAKAGGALYNFQLKPNWTSSFADNDGGQWSVANGGTGDDHQATSLYLTPCCSPWVPTSTGEQKMAGIRVLKMNNTENATWSDAVNTCSALGADLCDKSQYWVLRQSGQISVRMWANDHSDNEGCCNNNSGTCCNGGYDKGIGDVNDNPSPSTKYGYACCATERTSVSCPNGSNDLGGVCVAKMQNGGYGWNQAASDCASVGAHLCTTSQYAVLRAASAFAPSSAWSASHSDNDSNYAGPVSFGSNVSDDPTNGEGYSYACCY